MILTLRHLRYFVTVADLGSFSRAAATIHVAQPALSRQVLELEEIVGVELLHRTARGVRPTVAGAALCHEAKAILRQIEELPGIVRSAGGEVEGTVTLGMSSTLASFLSGPFMDVCKKDLPKARLRLVTADSMTLKTRVDSGQIDFAVVFEDEPTPGYARQPLFRQRLYLVRREPLPGKEKTVPLARLAELPVILPAHPNVLRILVDRVLAEAGVTPNMVGEADVLPSMLSAVRTGMADTILPKGDFSDVPGCETLLALPIEPAIFLTASLLNSAEAPLSRASVLVRNLLTSFVFDLTHGAPSPGAEWIGRAPAMPARHRQMPT